MTQFPYDIVMIEVPERAYYFPDMDSWLKYEQEAWDSRSTTTNRPPITPCIGWLVYNDEEYQYEHWVFVKPIKKSDVSQLPQNHLEPTAT